MSIKSLIPLIKYNKDTIIQSIEELLSNAF